MDGFSNEHSTAIQSAQAEYFQFPEAAGVQTRWELEADSLLRIPSNRLTFHDGLSRQISYISLEERGSVCPKHHRAPGHCTVWRLGFTRPQDDKRMKSLALLPGLPVVRPTPPVGSSFQVPNLRVSTV